MALPAKNRRTILVDGERYHWMFDPLRISGRDAFIAVQRASGTGRKLLLRWVGLALPSSVRLAILFAFENGWSPDGANDMEIGCDTYADPPQFRLKPEGAGPYWFHDQWLSENPGSVFLTPPPQ